MKGTSKENGNRETFGKKRKRPNSHLGGKKGVLRQKKEGKNPQGGLALGKRQTRRASQFSVKYGEEENARGGENGQLLGDS